MTTSNSPSAKGSLDTSLAARKSIPKGGNVSLHNLILGSNPSVAAVKLCG